MRCAKRSNVACCLFVDFAALDLEKQLSAKRKRNQFCMIINVADSCVKESLVGCMDRLCARPIIADVWEKKQKKKQGR